MGKRNILGVLVDGVDREAAVRRIIEAASARRSYKVTALAVHGVMTGVRSDSYRRRLNDFDLIVPDGQPVRWAMNVLYRAQLDSPVRGTDLTLDVLAAAERDSLPVFFYGSRLETLTRVQRRVDRLFPTLPVKGVLPSAFTSVDEAAQREIARALRDSGAAIVFVGLGCPRQETFVSAMSEKVGVPMLAVGAAFDYLAENLREPPERLKRFGLEWAWRLVLEPRRLWRRYLTLNPAYLALLALQALGVYRPEIEQGGYAQPVRLDV